MKRQSVNEGRKWSMHVDGKKIKTYTSKRAAVIAHNKFMKDTDNWKEVSIQAESVNEANTKSIDGKALYDFLQKRFKMSKSKAIATMKKHKMDLSFLKKESVNEMPNFDRGTSGLPKGFTDDYYKIVKKLSKGKGYLTLSKSDKKKVWNTLGKIYTESVNEGKEYKPEKRRKLKTGEVEVMKGKGSRQKWFYLKNKEEVKQLIKLGRNSAFPTGITNNNSRVKFDKGLHIKESVNEKISKDEWAQYPKYARKLKPYMQRLLKVPVKVRVIKQANHNPWIDVRVARFGKDVIPNDFRVKAAKTIGASGVRDWDNVSYGNIKSGSISLKYDEWVKLLGNKVKESVNESIQLPKGIELGKVFTGHGKSFVKEEVTKSKGVQKIFDIQKTGYAKLGGKMLDSLSAGLFTQLYDKASDDIKEKMNKMNEKRLYVVIGKMWHKFGNQVKIS